MYLCSTPTQWPKQLTANQRKETPREDFQILLENPPRAAGNVLEFSVVSVTVPGPVGQGYGETAGLGL